MGLLKVEDLEHGFPDKKLFNGSSFDLYKDEHMGIVGENGVGKSTLLKILTGEVIADDGLIEWRNGTKVGYIDQHMELDGEMDIEEYLRTAFEEEYRMESRLLQLYEEIAASDDEKIYGSIARLQEKLDISGFYDVDMKIDKIANGLGLDSFGLDTKLKNLSGGQRTKVILGKLLLGSSDVLLLDEPTNFLDKEHVDWLAEYLEGHKGAFIIVSHDVSFLERVTNCICDIEFQEITKYHGTYSEFEKKKKINRQNYLRAYNQQRREIEKTEEFIRRNKAGVNSKIARGRQKQLDRVERIAEPKISAIPRFTFESSMATEIRLNVKNLIVGYDYPILEPIDFIVETGEKVVITGFNGVGKSTLLKTIIGQINKLGGGYEFSRNAEIGYFEQGLKWEDGDLNALQILTYEHPHIKQEKIRRLLSRCGVNAEDVNQPIETLSGGEQSKVKIARMLLSPFNFLIMDEPTNHLDMETKEVLRDAIINFQGTVILVSHEEDFYKDFVHRIINIGNNK